MLQEQFNVFAADEKEAFDYGSAQAKWLTEQLPGADPHELGWAIIDITGSLVPGALNSQREKQKKEPGLRWGQLTSLMFVSRVAEALIASEHIPAGRMGTSSSEVGPELARFDMTQVYAALKLPSADTPGVGLAQLRREFTDHMTDGLRDNRQTLAEDLPGANLADVGWALIGTGFLIAAEVARIPETKTRRRSQRQKRENAQSSGMNAAMLIACIGDYFVSLPAQP